MRWEDTQLLDLKLKDLTIITPPPPKYRGSSLLFLAEHLPVL
jgi:hypothetical protein